MHQAYAANRKRLNNEKNQLEKRGPAAIHAVRGVPASAGQALRPDLQADLRGVQPMGAGSRPDAVGSGSRCRGYLSIGQWL